ncbi:MULTISPECIES: DUF1707 SHOCT-like domain-containing protein [unclassified Luteococcus]|uniref:DUF1707 SHOCT-like domain-containing protein n=1 Tax=unclassified Luteococcus TaxID=2639923 RepID=UPI00313DB239
MSSPANPDSPEPRIGDAEREQAAELLREHLTAGRLDHAEFDERIGQALQARTQSQLDRLFLDLPGKRPGQAVVPARDEAPLEWIDEEPEPVPMPWWTHWGLFVGAIVLSAVSRGRLGPLVLVAAVWVWWIGPNLARAQFERQQNQRNRELGR